MAAPADTGLRRYRVGLVLGTEVGFPEVLEDLLDACAPDLAQLPEPVALTVERVRLGPFRVDAPVEYDLLLDRVSHWHPFAREWLKTAALDGRYVINHPFHFQAMEKQVGYAAMSRLGLDVPITWALPPKDQSGLLPGAPERLHRLFDLDEVARDLGLPLFLKPHDGGGWVGVSRPASEAELHADFDASGTRVMLAQQDVSAGRFARCMVVGPRVAVLPYDPTAPLHARYRIDAGFVTGAEEQRLARLCRWICAFLGFEWNTVEVLIRGDRLHPIDFYNAVPDCSPVSLHDYFLWTVTTLAEWMLFCLLRGRRMRLGTRMAAWLQAARDEATPVGREARLDQLAEDYLQGEAFDDFCRHEGALVRRRALEYAQTGRLAVRVAGVVRATFPEHEVAGFTEYFRERIQPRVRPAGPWYLGGATRR